MTDDGRAIELAGGESPFLDQPPDRGLRNADDGRSIVDPVGER